MYRTFYEAADKYLMDNEGDMRTLQRTISMGGSISGDTALLTGRQCMWPDMPYKEPSYSSRECWRFDDHLRELYERLDSKLYGEEETSE